MIVLALDPSFTAFGYAVVDSRSNKVLETGCIQTSSAQPVTKSDQDRLTTIITKLQQLCKKWKVGEIWSETVVGSKSSKAAKALHLCRGALIGYAVGTSIPIKFCMAQTVKLAVAGSKTATKEEMVSAVDTQIERPPTLYKYEQEAVCDALAVYLYFSNHGSKTNISKT